MIALTVNGETRRTAATTIAELVRELDLDPAKVAVEHNGTIVRRAANLTAMRSPRAIRWKSFISSAAAQDDDSWSVAGRVSRAG